MIIRGKGWGREGSGGGGGGEIGEGKTSVMICLDSRRPRNFLLLSELFSLDFYFWKLT